MLITHLHIGGDRVLLIDSIEVELVVLLEGADAHGLRLRVRLIVLCHLDSSHILGLRLDGLIWNGDWIALTGLLKCLLLGEHVCISSLNPI